MMDGGYIKRSYLKGNILLISKKNDKDIGKLIDKK